MSAFLGKIHYWLYNKIKLHEELIEKTIDMAKRNGYDVKGILNESYNKYGYPVTGSLEDKIEHNNIHGWLQARIISVEGRMAYIMTELIKNEAVKKEDVAEIFYKNGADNMEKIGIDKASPEEFFSLIFDYMLEGMPCDHINEVTENTQDIIKWKTLKDIHKDYWIEARGDVDNFYYFRKSWINGFLDKTNLGYKYERTEDGTNIIKKD